jgi:hypothetical protein
MQYHSTRAMKPRDISKSQLWNEDDWDNSSISSMESASQASDDEEDHVCCSLPPSKHAGMEATLDRLTQHARYGGRKTLPSLSRPSLNNTRRYSRQTSASASSRSTNEITCLDSPMRKFRSNTSDSNLSTSRSFQTQRRKVSQANAKWDAQLNSPMRKFRSDTTSDSNLSTSRSFQSQRRKASQANAKWDVSDLRRICRAPPKTFLTKVSLSLSPKQRQLSTSPVKTVLPANRIATQGAAGSVCSKETRWSTSTHTLGGSSFIRCPLRHNSDDSLSFPGVHGSESNDESVDAPKRRGRKPAAAAKPVKDEEKKQAPESTEEKRASEEIKEEEGEAPAASISLRPGLLNHVIKDVMIAAQIYDEEDTDLASPMLPVGWNAGPISPPPKRCVKPPCGSLVSMLSRFHSLSPPRHRLKQTGASSPITIASDSCVKEQRPSMSDLGMKQPKRRGSVRA